MPNPDQIRDEFSPLIDGELDPESRATIEDELSGSAALLRELDQFKKVSDLYAGLPRVEAPEDFEARLAARMTPEVVPFWQHRAVRTWTPLLAAASVLVVAGGLWWFGGGARDQGSRFNTAALQTAPAMEAKDEGIGAGHKSEMAQAAQEQESAVARRPMGDASSMDAPATALMQASPATAALPESDARMKEETGTREEPERASSFLADEAPAPPPPPPSAPTESSSNNAETLGRGLAASAPRAMKVQAVAPADPELEQVRARFKADGDFRLENGVWIESGYAGESTIEWSPPAASQNAVQDAPAVRITHPVIFERDGLWYRYTPAAARED